MRKISNTAELKEAIDELEIKKAETGRELRNEFDKLKQSLKPANLIKNAANEVATSPSIRENILTGVAGVVVGHLAKRLLFGTSHNPIKKLAGMLLQMGIAGGASKIKSGGVNLLKRIFKKRNEEKVAEKV